MSLQIRLPFIGEERARVLVESGYDLEKIKNEDPDRLAQVLGVTKYVAYLIIKAAREANVENVQDELLARETICPKCGNVITELEYECGKCGYIIKENIDIEDYERLISRYVDLFIHLSKNPSDVEKWEELMHVYEDLGNVEEALDVSLRIDLLRDNLWSEEDTRDEREVTKPEVPVIAAAAAKTTKETLPKVPEIPKKHRFKNGLVNGFGVKPTREYGQTKRNRFIAIAIVVAIVLGSIFTLFMTASPYRIDGKLGEWSSLPSYRTFDTSIRTLKIAEYGEYYYLEIGGHIDTASGLNILIDSDGNPGTGFSHLGLGAEYRVWISEINGKISGSVYKFSGDDQFDWSGWTSYGTVNAKGGSSGLEMRLPKDIFTRGSIVRIINGDHITAPIGLFKPLLFVETRVGGGIAERGTSVATIYLNNTYYKPVTVRGLKIINQGSAMGWDLDLYSNGSVVGSGKEGDFISFSSGNVVKDSLKVNVFYQGGASAGETIMPVAGEVIGATAFTYSVGDGYYVHSSPSKPRIDGIFSDWDPYEHSDAPGDAPITQDIVAFATYAESRESYFYLQTRGQIASGILIPVSTGGPRDSDRDGIPDNEDPYPHDFNNDGIDDDDSYIVVNGNRVPDVDGDGIADYPHGEDYWLNTTIPDDPQFPEEYRGKSVSIYIGPPTGAKPIYPYDYIEIYIGGNDGFEIGGMRAQYLFRLYGIGGEIKDHEFFEFRDGQFRKTHIDFSPSDFSLAWDRLELKLPISIGNREVLYRVVSYADLYEDSAHEPFAKSVIPTPNHEINETEMNTTFFTTAGPGVVKNPDEDTFAGYFADLLESQYYDEVDLNTLLKWISTLDLAAGAESTHVFTGKDFIDGDESHFKEEHYAYQKMMEILKTEGRRPIYRVELLSEDIFREEWENLTLETKNWEILHWIHDLEGFLTVRRNYDNPYKINWLDEKEVRTLEWLVYKLSHNIDDWKLAFNIAKGIKSIDDAMIGPFFAIYPTKEARMTDWSTKVRAPGKTVTFQLVRWYSGTSDCNDDNDGYVKITLGSWTMTTGVRDDDDSWNAKIIFTNSNNSGSTAYVRIENWEDDSGLCGDDDDFGSATFTYYITTKTWSGASTTPYVHTSGGDGSADDWFVIESDDDNEAKLGIYDWSGDTDPMYGGMCFNDPWDNPTRVTYYSGSNYWGYAYYVGSYYEFYVPSGTTISVHMIADDSRNNYDLYLYDPAGTQKASSTNGAGTQDDITFTADSSGYWKIMVYVQYQDSDSYDYWFKFWFTSGPDDRDFVDITPTEGSSNAGYIIQSYGGVSYYDYNDEWKFYIPSSWISGRGVIYFWMKPNPNANFNVELYDPGGNLKASGNSGGTGAADYVLYELQSDDSAGYWFARVVPASTTDYGNYSIFYWVGYVVDFYAQTDNPGPHTPMHSDNGVAVNYYCLGVQYTVYPSDDYYWHVYVDRGSSYSYASESNLSDDAAGHRWISQNPPSGTINSGGSITGHYYEQFYLTIVTEHDTGYSSGKYFGADQSYSNPGSGWYDAGCTVTIRVDSPVTEGGQTYYFVSWSGSGTGSYSGTSNPASFTLQDVTTETANWEVPEFSTLGYFAPLLLVALLLRRRR